MRDPHVPHDINAADPNNIKTPTFEKNECEIILCAGHNRWGAVKGGWLRKVRLPSPSSDCLLDAQEWADPDKDDTNKRGLGTKSWTVHTLKDGIYEGESRTYKSNASNFVRVYAKITNGVVVRWSKDRDDALKWLRAPLTRSQDANETAISALRYFVQQPDPPFGLIDSVLEGLDEHEYGPAVEYLQASLGRLVCNERLEHIEYVDIPGVPEESAMVRDDRQKLEFAYKERDRMAKMLPVVRAGLQKNLDRPEFAASHPTYQWVLDNLNRIVDTFWLDLPWGLWGDAGHMACVLTHQEEAPLKALGANVKMLKRSPHTTQEILDLIEEYDATRASTL